MGCDEHPCHLLHCICDGLMHDLLFASIASLLMCDNVYVQLVKCPSMVDCSAKLCENLNYFACH